MEGLDCFALLAMTENVRRFWALFFYKSDNRYIFQFCSIISAICRIINKSCIVAKVTYGAAMAKKYPEQVLKETVVLLMAIRQEQEVSYQVLAREAGVSRPAISFVEQGKRKPSLLLCLKLALALHVSLGKVLQEAERRVQERNAGKKRAPEGAQG